MISIVIPCYNEEGILQQSIKKINNYFNEECEIIIVDDGSKDETRNIATSINGVRLNNKRGNIGKGYSVKEGIFMAKYDYILVTDADLSTPICEFEKLFKYIEDFNLVIGSRALKESIVQNSILRNFLGRLGNSLIQLLVGDIHDTQCGFKLFRRNDARKIFSIQLLRGFGFDFEILFLYKLNKLKIAEIPIQWNISNKSSITFWDYFTTLFELITVFIYHLQGKYK